MTYHKWSGGKKATDKKSIRPGSTPSSSHFCISLEIL